MVGKVERYIREQNLCEKGERIVVGASGGADSTALLLCLWEMRQRWDFEITAVHVHHGLRGEEADRDAAFAEELCESRGIPFRLRTADVADYAGREGLSLEEAGREERYRILREEADGGLIAVGHHREDQAETLLFHLFRGTGLRGLSGMAPRRDDIIRPLLAVSRDEIEAYLAERGQPYVTDQTNGEDTYTRNRIRHHLIPWVEKEINPRAVDHLVQLADQAREADRYLDSVAESWLTLYQERRGPGIAVPLAGLTGLDPAVGKRALMIAYSELTGSRRDLSSAHVTALWELKNHPVGSRCALPGGYEAHRDYECLYLKKREDEPQGTPLPTLITRVFAREPGQKIPEKEYTKWFDYDRIDRGAVLRYRCEGDYLELAGVGHKTVKSYMIDRKIPAKVRNFIPVLADGSHVMWIVGYRISEAYKVTEQTRTIFEAKIGGREDE